MSSQREAPHPYLKAWAGFHQKRQTVEGSEDPLHNASSSQAGAQAVPRAKSATLNDPSPPAFPGLHKRSDHRKGGHNLAKGTPHTRPPSSEAQPPPGGCLQPEPRTAIESPNGATYTSNSIGAPALFTPSGNAPSTGSINYPDRSIRPPELDVSPPFPDNNGQRPSSPILFEEVLKADRNAAKLDTLNAIVNFAKSMSGLGSTATESEIGQNLTDFGSNEDGAFQQPGTSAGQTSVPFPLSKFTINQPEGRFNPAATISQPITPSPLFSSDGTSGGRRGGDIQIPLSSTNNRGDSQGGGPLQEMELDETLEGPPSRRSEDPNLGDRQVYLDHQMELDKTLEGPSKCGDEGPERGEMELDKNLEGPSNCRGEGLNPRDCQMELDEILEKPLDCGGEGGGHQVLLPRGLGTQGDHVTSLEVSPLPVNGRNRDMQGNDPPSHQMEIDNTSRLPRADAITVNDCLVPGGAFWSSALRMIEMTVFDTVKQASSSEILDGTLDLSRLASIVKDAFLVALEEHHGPVSGSSTVSETNFGNVDHIGSKHKSDQVARNKGKGRQVERDNNNGNGDDDDVDDGGGSHGSEDDADDEDDNRQKPSRKRRPRSKIDNVCHRLLRQYLNAKGFNGKAIPEPPPLYEVDGFNQDGRGGPSLGNPKFDWLKPFTTPWNDTMAFQLANDFKASILSDIPHDSKWDDVNSLTKFITRKLSRTRRAFIDCLPPPAGSSETSEQKLSRIRVRDTKRAKARRRSSRRLGTFDRRGKIIEERYPEDTHLWGQIQRIHEALGQNGMSSDETETEAHGIVPKTVRRIPKVWINEEINQMWEMVETLGRAIPQPMGNTHHQRIFAPSASTSGSSKFHSVTRGLPRNFYSNLWWKSLTESQQSRMNRHAVPKSIPSKDAFKL